MEQLEVNPLGLHGLHGLDLPGRPGTPDAWSLLRTSTPTPDALGFTLPTVGDFGAPPWLLSRTPPLGERELLPLPALQP